MHFGEYLGPIDSILSCRSYFSAVSGWELECAVLLLNCPLNKYCKCTILLVLVVYWTGSWTGVAASQSLHVSTISGANKPKLRFKKRSCGRPASCRTSSESLLAYAEYQNWEMGMYLILAGLLSICSLSFSQGNTYNICSKCRAKRKCLPKLFVHVFFFFRMQTGVTGECGLSRIRQNICLLSWC